MDMKIIFCLTVCLGFRITAAIPVTSCPAINNNRNVNYYIADNFNRCVFYWCLKGKFVKNTLGGFTYDCPAGFGTSVGAHNSSNICNRVNFICRGGIGGPNGMFTPPPKTTTTTTRGPPKKIVQFLPGYHALRGQEQPLVKTLKECYSRCRDSNTCFAFDFNFWGRKSCWFHTVNTACGELKRKENCVHYRFVECATTTTPSPATTTTTMTTTTTTTTTTIAPTTTTQVTMPPSSPAPTPGSGVIPRIQTFSGQHLLGGIRQLGINNAYQCLSSCFHAGDRCAGVDFDNRTNGCYYHNLTTECTQFVNKPYCTHWRLTNRCTPTGGATPAPVVTTTTTAAPPTTMAQTTLTLTQAPTGAPTTAAPGALPTGFVQRAIGMHLLDGLLLLTGSTEQQCLDACLMSSFCLALDYNTLTKECYAHNTTTYCGQPVNKAACRHYKRAPCLAGAQNDIAEVRTKFHVAGGLEICTGCTIVQCLQQCATSLLRLCQGVDYDDRNNGCYVHRATTVCNPLQAKDFCTHYTRVVCTLQPTVTQAPTVPTPATIPAPVGSFMQINFMGPSILPSGWSAYPGMNIQLGTLIAGPGVDGDACVAACEIRRLCKAIDFNSRDGSCWAHLDDISKCDVLAPANEVYHMKKPPVCRVFPGTSVQYPTPFAVAP